MKHSFFADTKLQVDQIKKKLEAQFNKQLFTKKLNFFKSENDHNLSSIKLDAFIWSCLGSQLDLSLLSLDSKFSLFSM